MDVKRPTNITWWSAGARTQPLPAQPEVPAPIEIPVAEEPKPQQPTGAVPYVQPLVIVPYVSQDQPLYYYDANRQDAADDYIPAEYYEDMFEAEEASALPSANARPAVKKSAYVDSASADYSVPVAKRRRRFNVFGLLCFLLGGLYVAMLFDLSGLIDGFTYNYLYGGIAGFDMIKTLVESIIAGEFVFDVNLTLVPLLLTAGAVFAVITALCGIFTVASRTPIGIKIIAILAFLLNAAMAVVAKFIVKIETDTFGLYILAGLSLVMCVMALVARRRYR